MQPGAENFELAMSFLSELFGPRPNGTHSHKCPTCSTKWSHADTCAGDEAAHTCSQCGNQVWFRHYGE